VYSFNYPPSTFTLWSKCGSNKDDYPLAEKADIDKFRDPLGIDEHIFRYGSNSCLDMPAISEVGMLPNTSE
jgi:hypothetical protein